MCISQRGFLVRYSCSVFPVCIAIISCGLALAGCANARPTIRDSGQTYVTLANGEKRAILKKVAPEYPVALRKRGTSEVVILRLRVEPDGHVSSATAIQSANAELSGLAEAATKQWVFAPASDGKPTDFQMPITFSAH